LQSLHPTGINTIYDREKKPALVLNIFFIMLLLISISLLFPTYALSLDLTSKILNTSQSLEINTTIDIVNGTPINESAMLTVLHLNRTDEGTIFYEIITAEEIAVSTVSGEIIDYSYSLNPPLPVGELLISITHGDETINETVLVVDPNTLVPDSKASDLPCTIPDIPKNDTDGFVMEFNESYRVVYLEYDGGVYEILELNGTYFTPPNTDYYTLRFICENMKEEAIILPGKGKNIVD